MGDAVHHGQQEEGGCAGACVFDGAGGDFRITFFSPIDSINYEKRWYKSRLESIQQN